MLTMITGTPGAGKTLYTVWEIARKVPGSTIEIDGVAKPRRLLSNIKNLLLEHEAIGAEQLNSWHMWAQPGDVIVFDEVQEVWRPRGMGSKVPECIAALETHRHLGVDIVLVTQHPLLCDPNIRRLINQHLHLRRVTRRMAMVYEWDHCSNISSMRTAIQSRLWRHPKAAYSLYKSAQAHTKPTQRLPRVVWFGVAALAGAAFLIPNAIGRLQNSFGVADKPGLAAATPPASAVSAATPFPRTVVVEKRSDQSPPRTVGRPDHPPPRTVVESFGVDPRTVFAGCIISPGGPCKCVDVAGAVVEPDVSLCTSFDARPVVKLEEFGLRELPRLHPPAPSVDLDLYRFVGASVGRKAFSHY